MPLDSDQGEGVVRGALFGIVVQATTALFTAALTLYLVRALGPSGYGSFALGLSVIMIGILLADAALAPSAGRYVADARGDLGRVRTVIAATLRLKLILGSVVCVVLIAGADVIAGLYGDEDLAWPLRLFAISMLFEALLLLFTQLFIALRRQAVNARIIFLESLVETAASIGLVVAGGGVAGAAGGRALGYATGVLLGIFFAVRTLGRHVLDVRGADPAMRRDVARYARPLFATNSAYTAYTTIDTQLIAAMLTQAAVGIWSAPLRLVVLLGYVSLAVANAVAPRMSPRAAGGPDAQAFNAALRWLLVLHVGIVAGVVAWADPVVDLLLGSEFAESAEVLRALGPLILLLGLSPLASLTVNYLGDAGRRLPIVLTSLAVNVVLDLILLPAIGVLGAAIGTTVAYSIYVPGHLRLCRRVFPVPLRPLLASAARSLVAGAALAGVLVAFGTSDLSVAAWIGGLVLGPAAFVAVLVLVGELGRDELAAVRARLPRR